MSMSQRSSVLHSPCRYTVPTSLPLHFTAISATCLPLDPNADRSTSTPLFFCLLVDTPEIELGHPSLSHTHLYVCELQAIAAL
jgi:hypothetical protein